MKRFFLYLFTIGALNALKITYYGYKVFKVKPYDQAAVNSLRDLTGRGLGELWDENLAVNVEVRINVSPENLHDFFYFMKLSKIDYEEVIADIQSTIHHQLRSASPRTYIERTLSFSWDEYHNLGSIYAWLGELQEIYPKILKTVSKGHTVSGNSIKGVIINYHPDQNDKQIGLLDGTLIAREWICPAAITWIIKEFLTSNNSSIRTLAENFEWHIFPIVNPDGYEYTFTDNRLWKKNRNPHSLTMCPRGMDDMSRGVDLTRNFAFHWSGIGVRSNSCSNAFAGPRPFSEHESRAVRDYVLKINEQGRLIYYISFHSHGQSIIAPHVHRKVEESLISPKNADLLNISVRVADYLKIKYRTEYGIGVTGSAMYPMEGSSLDWVWNAINVPITLLFQLRDRGKYGFLLPTDQIVPASVEAMDALLEMDKATRTLVYPKTRSANLIPLSRHRDLKPCMSLSLVAPNVKKMLNPEYQNNVMDNIICHDDAT